MLVNNTVLLVGHNGLLPLRNSIESIHTILNKNQPTRTIPR
jgi:hypothetical protein